MTLVAFMGEYPVRVRVTLAPGRNPVPLTVTGSGVVWTDELGVMDVTVGAEYVTEI